MESTLLASLKDGWKNISEVMALKKDNSDYPIF